MTADQVLEGFTDIAHCAADIELKDVAKVNDILKALESLAKHKGLFEQDNQQKAPQIVIQTDGIKKPDDSGASGV